MQYVVGADADAAPETSGKLAPAEATRVIMEVMKRNPRIHHNPICAAAHTPQSDPAQINNKTTTIETEKKDNRID